MGLPAPSLIRTAKIATIESSYAEVIGHFCPMLSEPFWMTASATISA